MCWKRQIGCPGGRQAEGGGRESPGPGCRRTPLDECYPTLDNDCNVDDGLVRESVPLDQLSVKWKKVVRDGNQTVFVEVPEHLALKLLKKGKIRVGLVLCQLRLQDP